VRCPVRPGGPFLENHDGNPNETAPRCIASIQQAPARAESPEAPISKIAVILPDPEPLVHYRQHALLNPLDMCRHVRGGHAAWRIVSGRYERCRQHSECNNSAAHFDYGEKAPWSVASEECKAFGSTDDMSFAVY